jgi:hypothetical protein
MVISIVCIVILNNILNCLIVNIKQDTISNIFININVKGILRVNQQKIDLLKYKYIIILLSNEYPIEFKIGTVSSLIKFDINVAINIIKGIIYAYFFI